MRSYGIFYNPESEVLSILVWSHGLKVQPKMFINIPPKCSDFHMAKDWKTVKMIKEQKPELLINKRENIIDKLNYINPLVNSFGEYIAARVNGGFIVIDQPIDLDSIFGPLNGSIISFTKGDIDRIRKNKRLEKYLLKNSNIGKELINYRNNA